MWKSCNESFVFKKIELTNFIKSWTVDADLHFLMICEIETIDHRTYFRDIDIFCEKNNRIYAVAMITQKMSRIVSKGNNLEQ